jgi:Skp family chaperone for outer membrane proteins
MTRKLARFMFVAIVAISTCALAQTNTAAAASPAAPAASPAPTNTTAPAAGGKIGIINIQQAIVATNEGRRDLEALQKKFDPKRQQLETGNKDIEELKKQLNTQGDKLNDDARASLVRSIESKQKTLQRDLEDAQADYQAQEGEVVNKVLARLGPVVEKYAREHGYSVILDASNPQSGVLWAHEGTNITKAVVDTYNASSGVAAPPPAAPGASKPAGTGVRPATSAPKPAAPAGTTKPK